MQQVIAVLGDLRRELEKYKKMISRKKNIYFRGSILIYVLPILDTEKSSEKSNKLYFTVYMILYFYAKKLNSLELLFS